MSEAKISIGNDLPRVKPFLKWAGGKRQLLPRFQTVYPAELKANKIKYYYEPFVGSGAVFFDIAQQYAIEKAYLYDANEELVLAYFVVQQHVTLLINELHKIQKKYNALNKKERIDYFYEQRTLFNENLLKFNFHTFSKKWITRVAQLIFLNHTCFNGLYRVNAKGYFNTPVGDYNNPVICDEENLLAVAKLLKNAIIKKADFKEVLQDVKDHSFIYFDPPYRPISNTAAFTAYSKFTFNDDEQIRLAGIFMELNKKGVRLMLSNSDPKNVNPNDDFFDNLYKDYTIIRIPAKRLINSNAAKRGAINEIIVTNYDVQ